MSLTSYRAAPPRVEGGFWRVRECAMRALLVFGAALALCRLSLFALQGAVGWDAKSCRGLTRALLVFGVAFGRLGSDLLSRVLRRSTIGAEGFHGRVRDGIGCFAPRCGHQAIETHRA